MVPGSVGLRTPIGGRNMAQDSTIGKLSPEDLRILVKFWPELDALRAEVSALVRANPNRILSLDGPWVSWCQYYELPLRSTLRPLLSLSA